MRLELLSQIGALEALGTLELTDLVARDRPSSPPRP